MKEIDEAIEYANLDTAVGFSDSCGPHDRFGLTGVRRGCGDTELGGGRITGRGAYYRSQINFTRTYGRTGRW